MDTFHILLLLIAIAVFVVVGRPIVAIFNIALRGWIKSCRKTMQHIRN